MIERVVERGFAGHPDLTAFVQSLADEGPGILRFEPAEVPYNLPGGLTVPSRVRVLGASPEACVLRFDGTKGLAIAGQRSSIWSVKIECGPNAEYGVRIDGRTLNPLYWRLRDVTISADTLTEGQTGLHLVNSPTTGLYYGDGESVNVENFSRGLGVDADKTFGVNANRIRGLKVHNAHTAIDLGDGCSNLISDALIDLYDVGFKVNGIRNQIAGFRAEGGGNDIGYLLGPTAQENLLVGTLQTGAVGSEDLGNDNQLWLVGFGQAKPYNQSPPWLGPFNPLLADGDGTVPFGPGNAQFVKIDNVCRTMNLVGARLEVTGRSGHMSVALYELRGPTLHRLSTTDEVLVPLVGGRDVTFPTTTVRPGRDYYLGLSADNTSARFRAKTGIPMNLLPDTSPNVGGRLMWASSQGGLHPLPETVATAALGTDSKCLALFAR